MIGGGNVELEAGEPGKEGRFWGSGAAEWIQHMNKQKPARPPLIKRRLLYKYEYGLRSMYSTKCTVYDTVRSRHPSTSS